MTETPPEFSAAFRDEFAELIRWRRDVRRFERTPVDTAIIEDCLQLANMAPSVGLSQPWRFIDVTNADARAAVISSFERCNADALETYDNDNRALYARLKLEGLREAPVHMAVFADHATDQGKKLGRRTMPEMLQYSVVTAIHTFWLAARTHGLGVGWVSILDPQDVCDACSAPQDWSLVAYLCVGWPQAEAETPELERAGWEQRQGLNGHLTRA